MISINKLIWDEWNTAHISRHHVAPDEVEQVCHGDYVTLETYKGRVIVIGPTKTGNLLFIVLAPKEEGIYYPVTARVADRKERAYYKQIKGGDRK
ncbi:hypothetical protein A3F03_03545 [Candidatus Roizmanbacteria bacterium RIFCSPHIGHO2_12_FULL_41_11]|uniref:Toxin n=3 Tax=Candidatus Roizmaniibacteriota TaxID=1752723 RepID=A0A1F7JRZ4_9BACT|nr:MAG: hypothetical protein A3F03_03545 [Candidatus Roizmanbacteria bacterium RIFCSPHIGHO2_12_FULL_41_11]OGK51249.1 MAG: hypothetical protein A2966_03455 [Candidatus Roizmanbacteria bacterium RIFCSPLOWO2_01_FULL_41_22]OGK58392.1 MAG: hypothetical protein A3H86_02490 [Candidatus Roizmanbacteria bacterium RIFCSPLOWO2_02_FULL_41_9]